jgi:nucleotide-binding universal stress UspA family protein
MDSPLIVHPTDLSHTSEAAFFHALKLGLAVHARLSLVHFHDFRAEEGPDLDSFPHVREALARWGLLPKGSPRAAISDKLGLHLSKGEFLAADPEAGLTHLLHDQRAEFMVLGTRGLRGLHRLFKRSFSEELARDACIPTLFVPEGVRGFVDIDTGAVRLGNVLVPVAEDPDPVPAIRAAGRICRLLDQKARLHLLHVGDAPPPARGDHDDAIFHRIVRPGPVVKTILEVADQVGADLIVMATAGHKSFLDALRGSTTEEVLRKAHRPLLAVPAQSAYAQAAQARVVAEPSAPPQPPG